MVLDGINDGKPPSVSPSSFVSLHLSSLSLTLVERLKSVGKI